MKKTLSLLLILDKFTETIKDILDPSLERSEVLSLLSDFKYKFKKRKRIIGDTTSRLFKSNQKGKKKVSESDEDSDFINNLIIDASTDEIYLQIND